MAVPVWARSSEARGRTQPPRSEQIDPAHRGGNRSPPGETSTVRRDRSAPNPGRPNPLETSDPRVPTRPARELRSPEGDEESKRGSSRPAQKRAKLGKTTGVFAVGAWSARLEIAEMLQEGIPAEEILRAIEGCEEADHHLVQHRVPTLEDGPNRGKAPESRSAGPRGSLSNPPSKEPATFGAYGPWRAGSGTGSNTSSSDRAAAGAAREGVPIWVSSQAAGAAFARKALDPSDIVPSPSTLWRTRRRSPLNL